MEHDVVDVLGAWPGDAPAFLLIDALDAARGEPAARTLRELVREVGRRAERWRVVASIREYDLRYGAELRQLFAGSVPLGSPEPPLPDSQLRQVRHLVVGDFSDAELERLGELHLPLHTLVALAPPVLRKLLANPFNLSIAATLLESGRTPESIGSIATQMELLDAYWSARVEEGGGAAGRHARAAVLRKVAEEMIRVRALRAAHARVVSSADSVALDELLGANVLAEWQRRPDTAPEDSTLVFAHHRIFDYAVERALLRGSPIGDRLAADTQLVLFARPSVEMHFEHLWDMSGSERADFWAEVLEVCGRSGVRGIDALVGPGVAARRARDPEDVKALAAAVLGPESTRPAAERAVQYTLRLLLPGAGLDVILVGPDAGPWAGFLQEVSHVPTVPGEILWTIAQVLQAAARQNPNATIDQVAALGAAARRLLEKAWAMEPRSSGLVKLSMQVVLDFFGSSPVESSRLLRRALSPEHLARYGHEELRHFADYVPKLAARDDEFTRDLYVAAFTLQPPPETPTSFGGVIQSYLSNAAQDLGMGLYGLGRTFPRFLEQAPLAAASALISIARFHGENAPVRRREPQGSFDFNGVAARVTADYKGLWRRRRDADDEAGRLFGKLETYLVSLAGESGGEPVWRALVDHLVRENDRASIWAVLLRAGARTPDSIGEYLKPLLWATPLLGGVDTKGAAGEFVAAMSPTLAGAERERVERAIVAIDESRTIDFGAGRLRAALLNRLGGSVTTREALTLLEKWRADGSPTAADDNYAVATAGRGESEAERLARLGIPDDEPNRAIRDLGERASALAADLRHNRTDGGTARRQAFAILPALEAMLASAEADGVHPEQREDAYKGFVALCAHLAVDRSFVCDDDLGALVRRGLLEASRDLRPRAEEHEATQAKDWPMLVSRDPRGNAAMGLCALAGRSGCTGPDVVEAVERLAADLVDEVRVRIALGVAAVAHAEEALAWRIAQQVVETESVPGIVAGLMRSLRSMMGLDADRVAELAIAAHRQLRGSSEAPESRWHCVEVLTWLYLVHGHRPAREYLSLVLERPDLYAPEASHLLHLFKDGLLTRGDVEHPDPGHERLRERSFHVLTGLARGTRQRLAEALGESESDRESRRERVQALVGVLDGIGLQLYFATGRDEDDPDLSPAQRARLYRESAELFEVLAEVGLPNLTHHLVETAEVFIRVDPRGVFLRIASTIRSGSREGYHYDSMAEELFIRLVQRYLADHPDIFQEFEDCRDQLLDLLDLFVRGGSTPAMRLTYGLRELFL